MPQYSLIEEIAIKQLSSKALIQLSRLSRLIKKNTGHIINLQDPLLMKKLAQHVHLSIDPTTHDLFANLLKEANQPTTQGSQNNRRRTTRQIIKASSLQQPTQPSKSGISNSVSAYQRA